MFLFFFVFFSARSDNRLGYHLWFQNLQLTTLDLANTVSHAKTSVACNCQVVSRGLAVFKIDIYLSICRSGSLSFLGFRALFTLNCLRQIQHEKSLEDCPLALQNLPLLPRTIACRLEHPQNMLAGRAVFRKSCLYNSNTLVRWRWFLWSFVLADAHCYRHEERWHLAVALTIVDRGVYVQDGLQLRFKFAFHRCRTSSYFTYLSLKAVVDGADVSAFGAIVRLDIC